MKKYSNIFLDWGKTLSNTMFWEQWRHGNEKKRQMFLKIQTSIFATSNNKIRDWMRGKYRSEEIIRYIADATEQDYHLLLNDFILSCKEMEYSSREIPGLIRNLRGMGVRVNIATDNMDCFARWTIPALNLDKHFDNILNSYDLEALKTDTDKNGKSKFFTKGEERDIDINNSILLDDNKAIEPIIKRQNIDFRLITGEQTLEKHLKQLLANYASN